MSQQSPKLKRVSDIFTLLELVIGSRYPSTKGAETHAGKDLRERAKGRGGCLVENSRVVLNVAQNGIVLRR